MANLSNFKRGVSKYRKTHSKKTKKRMEIKRLRLLALKKKRNRT